ncbi:MAG: ABC transporter permease [Vicinamibacterales bacterium]
MWQNPEEALAAVPEARSIALRILLSLPASRATEPRHVEPAAALAAAPRPTLGTTVPPDGVDWAGLVWTLVRTDFKARYHGTASGFLWALLKPAAMFGVLVTVFSLVFRSEATYKLDLIVGLFLFDFFTEATKTGMTSFASKGFLLTKARLPRFILVLTSMTNAMLTLGVFAAVVLLYLALSGHALSAASILAFAAYLVALILIAMGISLGSSVLFLRYRDLNQVWDMVTQAGFFVAPIIYPLSVIPERFQLWLFLWPPTPIIEFSREALIDGVVPSARAHACLALMVACSLAAGTWVYRRYAPRAAEYV